MQRTGLPRSDRQRHPPSAWVLAGIAGLRPGAHVLDVACGSGRHVRTALGLGLRVTAVDIAPEGTADLVGTSGFTFLRADLEDGSPFPFADERFDAVIVTNYLFRPILPALAAAVSPAGLFIYETFALGQERFGRPTNPDFLLRPNELLAVSLGAGLVVLKFEHGQFDNDFPSVLQRVLAVGSDHSAPRSMPLASKSSTLASRGEPFQTVLQDWPGDDIP